MNYAKCPKQKEHYPSKVCGKKVLGGLDFDYSAPKVSSKVLVGKRNAIYRI